MQYICFMDKTGNNESGIIYGFLSNGSSTIPLFFTPPLIETHQSTKSSSSIIRRNYLQHKTHFGQIRVRLSFFLFLIPLPKINKNPGWCRIKLPGSSLSALQRQEE
ncbi:hypothetical protein CDAR_373321 [Caerostris darwini]|uniref:Uncharacterized protein n=1 Tax=Caerostris darwini TaxID=1538125 RepID=A0AAV4N0Y6_9ARAC|nr:hypothetical protein CDAR_373321 [Caerostris darwini]